MRVAILSRKRTLYSTSRLMEAGKIRGHDMSIIDHLKCDLVIEQNKPVIYYRGERLPPQDAIIPRIGASVTFYGGAVIRQFEMMDVYTPCTSYALIRSRDKLHSMQRLTKIGLGLPKSVFTNFSREPERIVKAVGGAPIIIKLIEGTQGIGVVLAETKKTAVSIIETLQSLNSRVIIQEFIQEAKGEDIRAFVVGDKVVGAMKRMAKEGEFRSNLHRGGSSEVAILSDVEKNAAIAAAAAMDLGIAGVDMLRSERGPLILEVNSSPGLEGIEGTTGVDIAGEIISYIERKITAS